MNDFKKHFSYLKEDLALTHEERSHMRAELELVSLPTPSGAVLSPFMFFSMPMRLAGALMVLLLVGVGGTSALAGSALPGDALYSVKIHINENVERSLAPTPLAKAEVDIKHAEERLSEVELLAAKGDATTEDVTNAAAAVATNVASASETAHDLSAKGDEASADGISAHISSALMAHADILDAQAGTLPDASGEKDLHALASAVSLTADLSDANQAEDASSTPETPAITKEVALAREAQVQNLIQKLTKGLQMDGVPAETHDELLTELAAIETDYSGALDQVSENDYVSASASYEQLGQRAYRALTLLRSARRINETTGQDVVITLDDSASPPEEKPTLMKATATLMAPNVDEVASTTVQATTDMPVLRKGDGSRTLEFRVRARNWESIRKED